jgi:arsenate reductase (thioredoxin)
MTGKPPQQVLFLCVENACRSLMAEAAFNANPPPGWRALSAGTQPSAAPNPRTAGMLAEIGLPLPDHPPRLARTEMIDAASIRVTMGCLDDASCPVHLKTVELRDWGLPDPAREDDDGFRRIRDEIVARTRDLVRELRAGEPPPDSRRRDGSG